MGNPPFIGTSRMREAVGDAIPDHPWIDSADGAAARIAMTVAAPGHAEGILEKVVAAQAHAGGESEVTPITSGGTFQQ